MVKLSLMFIAIFSVNAAIAVSPAVLAQAVNNSTKAAKIIDHPLTTLEQEKAILESMEEVVEQLDLLAIDKQTQLSVEEQIDISSENNVKAHDILLLEEALTDEGFEDLDIDMELADELAAVDIIEQLEEGSYSKEDILNKTKQSVGIKGNEEQIINQLDNSNLMDFDAKADDWLPELKKVKIKQDEMNEFE